MWEHITIPESLDLCPNDFVRCKHIVVGKGWQANHFFILFLLVVIGETYCLLNDYVTLLQNVSDYDVNESRSNGIHWIKSNV